MIPHGAYGFTWTGVAADGLVAAPAEWPEVTVEAGSRAALRVPDADAHLLPLSGHGHAVLRREPLRVSVDVPATAAVLAQVAAALSRRPAFQAGALLGPRGALAIAGPSRAGKSTLLAAAVRAGARLLCDELVVVDGGEALAGPAAIELRPDAAEHVCAEPATPPVSAPLAGWVFLGWGGGTALEPLSLRDRVTALTAAHVGTAEPGPTLLELARLPAWRLTRPRAWSALEPSVAVVLELLDRS